MKVVLLAGGLGTRLNEETHVKPKPMVEIGGKPILWHIMKIYSEQGFNEFVICLGYKSHYIKDWFNNYFLHNSDFTLNTEDNTITYHEKRSEKWKISLIFTGDLTMTGGRVKRIKEHIENETFMMTYGDGVADIDIRSLIDFHTKNKKIATITSVIPEGRFGTIFTDDDASVTAFSEKTDNKNRINGGFFVLEPAIFDYIEGDDTVFEKGPLEKLAQENELKAYHHDGFWKPMDTLNDKNKLEEMWNKGNAPWKIWK